MSLTEDQVEWLERLFSRADDGLKYLSAWQREFLKDQQDRWEEHGAEMWLSPKQIEQLRKISDRLMQEGL